MSYRFDMDDLKLTCSNFVIPLKMLVCSEKHSASGANHGYPIKVVIDRWPII